MIDENFRGKLADFGTSRVIAGDHMSHMTSVVSGTPGYVDPQYQQSGRYTEKSDAYSYGVVLAELITGRRPYFQGNSTLASFFLHAMKEKRLLDILDPRIRNDCDLEQVMVMANIASSCLNLEGEKRPTMILISLELEHTFSSHPDTKTTGNDKEEVAEASGRSREPLSIDVASTSTS
ncbi:wall-associated receptor kinase-like 10 [Brassica rapa]|nr:wall-associated receptor kinase-like 10 [Brassica rapa]